jgi:hypothetical protein
MCIIMTLQQVIEARAPLMILQQVIDARTPVINVNSKVGEQQRQQCEDHYETDCHYEPNKMWIRSHVSPHRVEYYHASKDHTPTT